jgi:hypothetical protein
MKMMNEWQREKGNESAEKIKNHRKIFQDTYSFMELGPS